MNVIKINIKIIFFILLVVIFTTNVFAKSDLTRYWSMETLGPKSVEEAKKILINKEKLNLLEGIWKESDDRLVLIIYDLHPKIWAMHYSKYIIQDQNEKLIGTKDATFHRTKKQRYFIIFQNYKNNTVFGKVNLHDNKVFIKLYDKKNKTNIKNYSLTRIFP